jgi:hypothetical protein
MSTDIVKREQFDLGEVTQLGAVFRKSGYFRDVKDEAQAIVKILYGQELGLSPVVSMMGLHIVEGKPELSANLLASKVKTSGRYDYRVKVQSDTECTITFFQDGEASGESTFTIEDAKKAGIYRNTWTKYPKAMLFARALSQGVRSHCPDVGMGVPLYVAGEISGDGDDRPAPEEAKTERVRVERAPEKAKAKPAPEPAPPPDAAPDVEREAAEREPPTGPFITPAQQRALHDMAQELLDYEFRGRRTTTTERRKALGDWLEGQGYVGEDEKGRKRGSTKIIPQREFLKVRSDFADYTKTILDMAASVEEKVQS